jgi:predicted RNA-binding protein with PUA-like domain
MKPGKTKAPSKGAARKGAPRKSAAKKSRGPLKPSAKRKPAVKKAKAGTPSTIPTAAPYSDGKWAEAFAPRSAGERRYWLVKSEPTTFSFDDLLRAPSKTTIWDGVRNFVARNFLRDGMRLGDRVFFYHSSTDPQAIVGICEVAREGYPDPTALDSKHPHYDPDSDPGAPRWYMVDLRAVAQFTHPVTLAGIKARKELSEMALIRIGRLSVTPVRAAEWETIIAMAGKP